MRLQKYLQEKYLTRIKHFHSSKTSFEVWVNPTSKELRNIGRYVKFIADNKGKKLYFLKFILISESTTQTTPHFIYLNRRTIN